MSFSIKFLKSGSLIYALPSPAPFISPTYEAEYVNFEPPVLSSLLKRYDVEGVFQGTEATVAANWNTFVSAVTNASNMPDEIQLLSGASVVDRISVATGYTLFKIESIESPKSDLQWRGEMRFRMRVSGRKIFLLTGVGGTNIVYLEQKTHWSYSPEGMLTQTLTGRLKTEPGTSATLQAQQFGLKIPGPSFAFVTNGPGGVDVEQENLADSEATFVSTITQSAISLPANVAPDYSRSVEITQASGETVTVTSVRAAGTGAATAVSVAMPGGPLVSSKISTDDARLTADAVYVTKDTKTPGASFTTLRSFTITGGGTPYTFSARTGRRDPVLNELPRTGVVVVEDVSCVFRGNVQSPEDLTVPSPLNLSGLVEDTDAMRFSPYWTRREIGAVGAGDMWAMNMTRVYKAPNISGLSRVLSEAAIDFTAPGDTSQEFGRKG